MLNKTLTGAALAAAMMIPGAVQAASIDRDVTVRLVVNPILLMFVTQDTVEMTADDLTDDSLDGSKAGVTDNRAVFWVVSNDGYDIEVAPAATWGGPSTQKVRFEDTTDSSVYIAGELFLDRNVDSGTNDASEIVSWDASMGKVSHSETTRGIRKYGVGAIFDPTDWSGAAALPAGAPAGAADIAPAATYSSTVTVTVSND